MSRRSPLAALAAFLGVCFVTACFAPFAAAQTQTIPGSQIDVLVSDDGNLQARLDGATTNLFHNPNSPEGDAGLWIGFPAAVGSIPAGSVAGPDAEDFPNGETTPGEDLFYETVSQSVVGGDGSAGNPFQVDTKYRVVDNGGTTPAGVLEVTQEVRHQTGSRLISVRYLVKNVSAAPVRFRASAAADLYLENSNAGYGFYSPAPPEFVGAFGTTSGPDAPASAAGGIREVDVAPWSSFQEGNYLTDIWTAIDAVQSDGFNNTVVPTLTDNGVGVQWDDRYTVPLGTGAGDIEEFSVVYVIGTPSPGGTPPDDTPPLVPPVLPPSDTDGDGVLDVSDACPTVAADTFTGCPPSGKPAVTAFKSALRKALGGLSLSALSKKSSVGVAFKAPGVGKLTVKGTAKVTYKEKVKVKGSDSPKTVTKTKTVGLLKGTKTFSKPGLGKVALKVTPKGKLLLKQATKVRLLVKNVFVDAAKRRTQSKLTLNYKAKPKSRTKAKNKGKGKSKGKLNKGGPRPKACC